MIFKPELVDLIRAGMKTETRRPVKPGQPCRYVVGRTYAVQPGRGKRGVCRIRVIDVRRERLDQIDWLTARREGFSTERAFLDYWRGLYGAVDLDQLVWAIRFEVTTLTEIPASLTFAEAARIVESWSCCGQTFTGTSDFISGARAAHVCPPEDVPDAETAYAMGKAAAASPDERLREAAAWLVELAAAAVCEPRRFAENETELQWKTADAITATRAALAAADRETPDGER